MTNGGTMKIRTLVAGGALVLAGCAGMHMGSGGGWTSLYDGKSLDGWNRTGNANWRIEDGLIVADKGRGFIVSPQQYKDFEMHVEFWADEDANSGVYFRCTSATELSNATCYEANIFDKRPQPFGTGAITDLGETTPRPLAAGRWNTYDLTVKGDHFVLVMNGVKTADVHDAKRPNAGNVGLQFFPGLPDKGVIKFRKVEIRPIS
jgi:hypothetical protein